MPTQINHHRSMVRRKDTVNGISRDHNRLNVDQLILVAGAEKDMVDALVDQLRTGLERSRGMCRRQGDGIGCATAGLPSVDQDIV